MGVQSLESAYPVVGQVSDVDSVQPIRVLRRLKVVNQRVDIASRIVNVRIAEE